MRVFVWLIAFFLPLSLLAGGGGGKKDTINGRIFIVSAGINNYSSISSSMQFQNCTRDAVYLTEIVSRQTNRKLPALQIKTTDPNYYVTTDKDSLHCQVLLEKNATRPHLFSAINRVIDLASPNDIFIFNFSGVSIPSPFDTEEFYFITHEVNKYPGLISKNLQVNVQGKEKDDIILKLKECSINLSELKDLLELIPCKKQLFISEAGPSEGFTISFVKKLIESETSVASLLDKNRIFILPSNYGLDSYENTGHGPLMYFLGETKNLLDVFTVPSKVYKEIISKESEGSMLQGAGGGFYSTLFSEKEYLKQLFELFPSATNNSRGARTVGNNAVMRQSVSGKHALLIATDHYDAKGVWNPLSNPVLDATNIEKVLRESYGFKTKLLIDSSSNSIYRNILHYASTLDSNAQLFVFFAGHGYYNERFFDEGYIVCKESKSPDTDPFLNTYIPFSKIEKMINKIPAKQVFVVMDVCFGGAFNDQISLCQNRNEAFGSNIYQQMQADEYVSKKLRKITRRFLTSGGKEEVPDGYKGKSSPFALKFLEALRSMGGEDGILTTSEIFSVVERVKSEPRMGSFGSDECGSDFFFIPLENQTDK